MWFKVDDDLAFHRKTVAAGNAAMGLWVRAGSWCGQQLSDGRIPADVARTMGKPSEIKALVRVGLWEIDGDFYVFHDFFARNPSRTEVEAKRATEAKKKADWRARRAGQGGVSTGDKTGDTTVDSLGESDGESLGESRSSRPDPTRPGSSNEELSTSSRRKRATPETYEVTDKHRTWAAKEAPGIDLAAETDKFLDYHRAKGSTMKDWDAAWRTWIRNAVKFAPTAPKLRAVGDDYKPWLDY